MKSIYYTKEVKCPVCSLPFSSTKVRTSVLKMEHKDEDFCVHYKEHNPIYYDIFVCPNCGYASSENSFNDLGSKDIKTLINAFLGRSIGRNFCGIRSHTDALDSYKIALYTANLIDGRKSYTGGLALKTAWMYRYINDPNERIFLKIALDSYTEAYEKERFPINGMDELTVIYLIGELSRRLEIYDKAIEWFSKVVSHPEREFNVRIEKLAREQWHLVRDLLKKI
ncbi:hypothetical protein SDC9_99608 [bioreactor metagenome]|uniref:DUF2225 domain-containing protein n=1 Tax=bioreactor metagenome TaxID=1076179 RepID=A0A645ATF6_9ZZZZ|nr:DUF2225 domain-containing protein [Lutispora sp.]MEA4960190.1 DUF2225 domain-containing protein [Lutispora sp.]HCJ59150.1 DUF2225 domain-containing protein [Clostridiaceae bacterium]